MHSSVGRRVHEYRDQLEPVPCDIVGAVDTDPSPAELLEHV